MSFSDFTTDHGRTIGRQHYLNLIEVFRINGKTSPAEYELLKKEGVKFGLTDEEIERLIHQTSHEPYHAPYSLEDKFEQLYNVAEMVLADDDVTDDEIRLLRRFAIEVGFDDRAIDILRDVLIGGIRNKENEEVLLKKFKKELFKR
jgi:uncharacterized tellurite resistance protein B-like protein